MPETVLKHILAGAFIQTQDLASKYEIEAYLANAKTLFEKNLVGLHEPGKQNLLGNSFGSHPETRDRIKRIFVAKGDEFFNSANAIRNHAYHVNSQLNDPGVFALLKHTPTGLTVTLPNVYDDAQGNSVDLVEVFISTHRSIEQLIREIIDTLLEFFFRQDGPPSHGSYQPVQSPYGTTMAGLGPKGFEYNPFHEAEAPDLNSAAPIGLGCFVGRFTQGGADFVSLALGYYLSGFQPLQIGCSNVH